MDSAKMDGHLASFFIFNPEFGGREGEEHNKLLFYYPQTDSLDVQIRNIGFCEAVVRFTASFSEKTSLSQSLHTDKQLHVYFEPEANYIMGMLISKHQEPKIHESACTALQKQSYKMFRLFFGTFEYNMQLSEGNVDTLRQRIGYFFDRYVPSLRFSKVPILDILCGINFMPLEQTYYLRLQSALNRFMEVFPVIKHTIFLYNNRLLWYNIPQDDMCILYRYLAYSLLPSFIRAELQPTPTGKHTPATFNAQHYGKFLTGPADLDSSSEEWTKLPKIFIHPTTASTASGEFAGKVQLEAYQLVIYRALNATLCMLVDINGTLDLDFYRNVDSAFGPQLTSLTSDVGELYGKLPLDSPHHYIYYNAETRSVRTTFDVESTAGPQNKALPPVNPHAANTLCELREQMQCGEYFGDMIVKSESDIWLAAKKSGERELYVIVNQPKNATMTDVTEEVRKLCASHFTSMFLTE